MPFGLRHVDEHEDPSYERHHGEEAEDALQAEMEVEDGKRVGHDHIAGPHRTRTETDARAANPGGENLGAQDVGDGPEAGHKGADEDSHTDEGDQGWNKTRRVEQVNQHQCE